MSPARGTQVVQSTRSQHDLVGEAFGEITQDIFNDATALHARQSLFAANANAGQPLIGAFLGGGQLTATWLFFG